MRYSLGITMVSLVAAGLLACGDSKPPTPLSDAGQDQLTPEVDIALDNGPLADVSVDITSPDVSVDAVGPDAERDAVGPDATVDSITLDATVDATSPDATVDTISSDSTVDTVAPDGATDSVPPDGYLADAGPDTSVDATVDSGTCTGPTLGNWTVDPTAATAISTDNVLFSVDARGPTEIFVGGSSGKIWRKDAAGWFLFGQIPSAAAMSVQAIWLGPTQIFAAGGSLGAGFVAHHDGTQWHTVTTAPGTIVALQEMRSVWGASDGEVYAVGDKELLRWTGSSWSLVNTSTTARRGLWGDGISSLFIGTGTNIERLDTNTLTSIAMAKPYTGTINAIWGSSGADVLAGMDNDATGPTVIRFNGVNWSTAIATSTFEFQGIHGSGPNDVLAVGSGSVIFHFGGAQWLQYPKVDLPNTTSVIYDVWAAPTQDLAYAVGATGLVWKLTRCP